MNMAQHIETARKFSEDYNSLDSLLTFQCLEGAE